MEPRQRSKEEEAKVKEHAAERGVAGKLPVYGEPRTWFEADESGERWDPDTATVGWSLSFDCNLTFGKAPGGLEVTLNVSGSALRNGIVARLVTREQIEAYALQLLALARDAVEAGAGQHGAEVRRG